MASNKNNLIRIFITLLVLTFITRNGILGGVTTRAKNITTLKPPPKPSPPQGNKNSKFVQYKKTHKKVYASAAEEKLAQKIYEKTQQDNEDHNKMKNSTYQRGENSDTDKSYEWKQKHRMGLKKPENPSTSSSVLPKILQTRMDQIEIPDEADWSSWCTPVKDQSEPKFL